MRGRIRILLCGAVSGLMPYQVKTLIHALIGGDALAALAGSALYRWVW